MDANFCCCRQDTAGGGGTVITIAHEPSQKVAFESALKSRLPTRRASQSAVVDKLEKLADLHNNGNLTERRIGNATVETVFTR